MENKQCHAIITTHFISSIFHITLQGTHCKSIHTGNNLISLQGTLVLIAGSLFSLKGFSFKSLYFPVRIAGSGLDLHIGIFYFIIMYNSFRASLFQFQHFLLHYHLQVEPNPKKKMYNKTNAFFSIYGKNRINP